MECGDELPEERICDECASRIEIDVYIRRYNEYWRCYAAGEPVLVTYECGSQFEVETVLDEAGPIAIYNEAKLRWESKDY